MPAAKIKDEGRENAFRLFVSLSQADRFIRRSGKRMGMKHNWKPGTMIYPLPAVLVSCGATPEEYNINLTTEDLAFATDWCGVRSGRDYRKFEEMKLTPGKAGVVRAPIVEEAPVCIECRVKEIVPLGSHDLFLAEVVNVQADDRYLNPETGKFELDRANPLVYTHGEYFGLGKKIGKFGWSVEKKKKKNKK